MQRIKTTNRAVDLHGAGKDGFQAGTPTSGVKATYLSPEWCNAVQEEFANVLEGFGARLDEAKNNQLFEVLKRKFNDSATRAIVTGSTDPVAPPGVGGADKYGNNVTGEIWQYFEGIGWATIARQQGAKISGDASLTKFGAGAAWESPVALKSFVVPRDGDVSIQADAYFTNATTLTFCYTSIYKNLAGIEGNQTQYPVPCVTPYQSATLTASRVKVFKGDVITVGFGVGMSCNCQYAFNVQYIN
jgi:hypothetical protein